MRTLIKSLAILMIALTAMPANSSAQKFLFHKKNHLYNCFDSNDGKLVIKNSIESANGKYVVGVVLKKNGTQDVFVEKFDSKGALVWMKKSGGDETAAGMSIAVDEIGNTYITGYFSGTTRFDGIVLESRGSNDIFVAKYDGSTGKCLWARCLGDIGNDAGIEIRGIDASGSVYVTVGIHGGNSLFGDLPADKCRFFTVVYSSEGEVKSAELLKE